MELKYKKCVNCGAGLRGLKCEYCGSEYIENRESSFASSVVFEKSRTTANSKYYCTGVFNNEFTKF